jgi:hypothetical protein
MEPATLRLLVSKFLLLYRVPPVYGGVEIKIKISRIFTLGTRWQRITKMLMLPSLLHRMDVFNAPEVSKVHIASIFKLDIEDGGSLYLRNVASSRCEDPGTESAQKQ